MFRSGEENLACVRTFRRLVVLVLVTVFALVGGAAEAQAAFPGFNGKIAFHSNRDGDYDVYTMNADGTDVTNLTNNVVGDVEPAWSSDGRKITFVSCPDNPDNGGCSGFIHTMNADGTNEVDLGLVGQNPAWSPDGTQIVYLDPRLLPLPEIHIANADGTGDRSLGVIGRFPTWSPDGQTIAYSQIDFGNPNASDIFLILPDGTGQTRLTFDGGEFVGNWAPDWSPDGTKLVWWRSDGSSPGPLIDLYTINVDGTGRSRLTETADFHEEDPVWSPDGTRIAFVACCYDVFVMRSDATAVTQITSVPADDESPDWQPLTEPQRGDYKNASAYCKALREALGEPEFSARYKTHGSCVSANR